MRSEIQAVTNAQKHFSNESGTPVKKPIPHDFKQPTNFPTSTMIQYLATMGTDPIDKFRTVTINYYSHL